MRLERQPHDPQEILATSFFLELLYLCGFFSSYIEDDINILLCRLNRKGTLFFPLYISNQLPTHKSNKSHILGNSPNSILIYPKH